MFKERKPSSDFWVATAIFVVAYLLASHVDLFEYLFEFTREYEEWDADEIILIVFVLPLPLSWFAYRKKQRALVEESLRHRTEEALARSEKMKSLGVLAGGVAHELNNQLLPVVSMSGLIQKSLDKDDPNYRKAELISKAAEVAKETVAKILTFAHGSKSEAASCDLQEVGQTLKALIGSLHPANVKVGFSVHGTGELLISESDLQSVIVNLFGNGVDAIGEKTGKVEILIEVSEHKVLPSLEAGTYCHIRVEDDGPGIAEESLAQIFDPFFTTKPPGQGVGLGLSIVHSTIEKAGGVILADSWVGEGSRFDIYLPMANKNEQLEIQQGEACHG